MDRNLTIYTLLYLKFGSLFKDGVVPESIQDYVDSYVFSSYCTTDAPIANSERLISDSIQVERTMIVVRVLFLIISQRKVHLAYNQKENYYYDQIPFSFKVIKNIFL